MNRRPGIYVEIIIKDDLDHIWHLTQQPDLHRRWDLRFSEIQYLPRPNPSEPQNFLYETRMGFGLSIRGTGESVGQRAGANGERTSSLKFASADPKSLIREGSGYWRYIPTPDGVRFLTWYDYEVRFGALGRFADRLVFRPAMGWATAWSFDQLRLWAEDGRLPESSTALALIHAVARISIAAIWLWHGLVPKLLFHQIDEQKMLAQTGLPLRLLPWIGAFELLLGILVLCSWDRKWVFVANVLLMLFATMAVAAKSPAYLVAAFNPVTLNFAMIALSVIGWIASRKLPSARHCRRSPAKEAA